MSAAPLSRACHRHHEVLHWWRGLHPRPWCHGGASPPVGKEARAGPRRGVSAGAASLVAPGLRRHLLRRKPCTTHLPSCRDEPRPCATEHRRPGVGPPCCYTSSAAAHARHISILAREQIFTEAEQCVRAGLNSRELREATPSRQPGRLQGPSAAAQA